MTIHAFQIEIAEEILLDLQARLAHTRWPDAVEASGWDYGTNLAYLQELVAYWQGSFRWRDQERMLNRFAQFKTEVDGLTVHFIHEKGVGEKTVPLLLLHGWPDSFMRFYKIIPMLTNPARFGLDSSIAFDVIVPSLPGFGFSERPLQRGGVDIAGIMAQLMTTVLGYERFGVHGGDVGGLFAKEMAARFSDAVVGIHLTDIGWEATAFLQPETLNSDEKAFMEALAQWQSQEGAYYMIQGTKPQTLAYGLTDSPVGLAAWIVGHFRAWSDCDGEVERRFSKDELLTNIMLYWVTGTINSSMRYYYEGMNVDWEDAAAWDVEESWGDSAETSWQPASDSAPVPVGVALFPKDIPGTESVPRSLAERTLNIQHWTEMASGGHFAALEEPALLAKDLYRFFRQT